MQAGERSQCQEDPTKLEKTQENEREEAGNKVIPQSLNMSCDEIDRVLPGSPTYLSESGLGWKPSAPTPVLALNEKAAVWSLTTHRRQSSLLYLKLF